MNKIKTIIITSLSLMMAYMNKLSLLLVLLFISNIIDVITGIWKSAYLKQKITMPKMLWGFIKKISMFILIVCGLIIDVIINYTVENFGITTNINGIVGSIITIWLILDEQLSILCNLTLLKVPMPSFLYKLIKNLQEKIDKKATL